MKNNIRNMSYLPKVPYTLQPVYTANIKTGPYQRKIDKKKVSRIIASFDEHIANEPKLSCRDGEFFVFDGQHTIAARKKMNGGKDLFVLCKVYNHLTPENEAILFSMQTGVSSKPTPGTTLRARDIGKDKESHDFIEANLAVGVSPSYSLAQGMCRLRCINTAKNEYQRIGEEKYKEALAIIVAAWKGHPKALHGAVVISVCEFVGYYFGEYNKDVLIRKLSYTDPYDIVKKAKSLGVDGGHKSALMHILEVYNHNNPKPLPVSF